MDEVLLDANVLIAFFDADDVHHQRAVDLVDGLIDVHFSTTEHVFDEVMGVIQRKRGKNAAIQVCDEIFDHCVEFFFSTGKLFAGTMASYKQKGNWSFTDAHLLTVANSANLPIATFDAHFQHQDEFEIIS